MDFINCSPKVLRAKNFTEIAEKRHAAGGVLNKSIVFVRKNRASQRVSLERFLLVSNLAASPNIS